MKETKRRRGVIMLLEQSATKIVEETLRLGRMTQMGYSHPRASFL